MSLVLLECTRWRLGLTLHIPDLHLLNGRHLYQRGSLSLSTTPWFTGAVVAAALFHVAALTSSRLFLGVHSVGDVRAGVVRVLQELDSVTCMCGGGGWAMG